MAGCINAKLADNGGLCCATPALVGDKLYVFARQGGDEVILCLNATDGTEVWQEKYAAREVTGAAARHSGPRSSPAVAEGKVPQPQAAKGVLRGFVAGSVCSCSPATRPVESP